MSTQTPTFPPGWKVFPLIAGTKEPIFKAWPAAATDDPVQIAAWAAQYPNCNWALATGASGLAVVDIDGAAGEVSLLDFELDNGPLPPTLEQRSARGGRHKIYAGTIKPTVAKLGPKIDTRGGNSYIVIAPSTFEGGSYEFTNSLAPAPLPEFVSLAAGASLERVSASDALVLDTSIARGRAKKLLEDYRKSGHIAVEGQGGDALTFAVAAEVINFGLSPEVALEVMEDWNAECQPPWDIDELRVKIENASQYAQNDAGAWYVPPVNERIPSQALDKLRAESMDQPDDPKPSPGERNRFAWMGEDEFKDIPPPQWLVKDLLVRDSIGMLYGPSGHYKSFLALNLAAQVAQRGELAFYVAAEGISRMATCDYPAWKLAYGQDAPLPFYMVEDMPLTGEPSDVDAFMRSIDGIARREQKHVGLVILDTLNNAMLGLEENSAKDAGMMIQELKRIKRAFKTTVMVVHHTPADGSNPRGSTALYAAFDSVIKVVSKTESKLAQMFVTKQKTSQLPGHPFSFAGRRMGPGLAFTPITAKEAGLMTSTLDIYSPKKIAAALVGLKAFKPVWVSSEVLLRHIVPQLENESPEERNTSLTRASAGLRGAIKGGKLDGYYEGIGRGIKWSLPTPNEEN